MKTKTKIRLLVTVTILEALAIVAILVLPIRVIVTQGTNYVENPLLTALRYKAPIERFEQELRDSAGWINHTHPTLTGPHGQEIHDMPILARCAIGKLTNHVAALIRHGADTNAALAFLHNDGMMDAIELIESCVTLESANMQVDRYD